MLNRKEKIVISAIELLGQEGVSGLTIKNLAKSQNVSEPALYRQFKSKQDILNQIIDEFSSYDVQIQETIIQSDLFGREAIMFYISRYAELYENYAELTTVVLSLDLFFYNEYTKNKMTNLIKDRKSFINKIVEADMEEFELGGKMTSLELASIIQGMIFSQVYEWRLMDKSYSLKDRLEGLFDKML